MGPGDFAPLGRFGDRPYEYKPAWDKQIDRHPDRRPSSSRIEIAEQGRDLVWMLEVRGLGVITMRASSDADDPQGRMVYRGLSMFTKHELEVEG